MQKAIPLAGIDQSVRFGGNGEVFEFSFVDHEGKKHTFSAPYEAIEEIINKLVSIQDILSQRRAAEKDPEPGDMYPGRARNVRRFQVGATDGFNEVFMRIFTTPTIGQTYVFSPTLAEGLKIDLQTVAAAADQHQKNSPPAPVAKLAKKGKNLH